MAGIYRAEHITQKDGSRFQFQNCRMAVAATKLDYHTKGAKKSTGAKMRQFSGDTLGGTNADDARRAWEIGYNESLVIRDGRHWEALLEDRSRGWFISLDVWYARMPDRCQSAANFGHTIGVAPETRSNGDWLISDPLCTGYKWMDPTDIKAAAEAWGTRILNGGDGRTLGPDDGQDDIAETGGSVPIRYTTAVEVAPVLRVIDPTPATVDVAVGVQIYDVNGQPTHKATQAQVQAYSPFASRIGATVPARAVYRGIEGVRAVALVRTVDCKNIKPIPPSGIDPDEIVEKRDTQWVTHLTPPK